MKGHPLRTCSPAVAPIAEPPMPRTPSSWSARWGLARSPRSFTRLSQRVGGSVARSFVRFPGESAFPLTGLAALFDAIIGEHSPHLTARPSGGSWTRPATLSASSDLVGLVARLGPRADGLSVHR